MSTYGTAPQRPRRWLPIVAAVVVGLGVAGVGAGVFFASRDNAADHRQTGGLTVSQLQSEAARQDNLPACADVFAPGKTLDASLRSAGYECRSPNGETSILAGFDCTDGRALWSVDVADAGTAGWGFTGDAFHATSGPVAEDAAYGKAYATCHS